MDSVIESELQFSEVEGEFCWIHAMIFHQSFFGKRPEYLDIIDVNLPVCEPFTIINTSVFESIRDKTIVTSEPVCVDQTPAFNFPDS